jgi:PAS domain S-box-containing protein
MVMTDAQGRIALVNRELERLFGYTRDEMIGRSIELLVPERHRSIHPRHRARYGEAPVGRAMGAGRELFARRKDGSEFAVEVGLMPVESDGRQFVIGSVMDIGERRRLEAQVRHAQKMDAVGSLAGGIAHDFNNVLSAILGYATAARDAAADQPEVAEDLSYVLRAAERGRVLVQGILAFSRRSESPRQALNLETALQEVVPLLRATLPATIQIDTRVDPGTPHVLADATQIHQVLVNLATNAAQAMGARGGTLEMAAAPVQVDTSLVRLHPTLGAGRHARITVTDTGEGMTPEVLARAFEPFFTTRPPGEGTGLGLAVVHGIVLDHGGAIGVQSAPGRGTTVQVYIPEANADPVAVVEEPGEPPRGVGERILYVDDEPDLSRLWRRMLEGIGYAVEAYPSGVAALEALRARPHAFDAVITDYSMPGMTGVALAEEVRRLRPDLPVLLMTGYSEGVSGEVLERGLVRRLIPKPFSTLVIAEALREALDRRPS